MYVRLPRHIVPILVALLLALSATSTLMLAPLHSGTPLSPQTAHAAPQPDGTPLLLVHGYSDSCAGAFETGYPDPTNDQTLVKYLSSHGYGPGQLDTIGYYSATNPKTGVNYESGCDYDANVFAQSEAQYSNDPTIVNHCNPLLGSNPVGTYDDPIKHLGCVLAWFISYHYNSTTGVDILAHSMGGLVVRAAIFFSGHDSAFPPAINVRRVVTIGTPHGGLASTYGSDAYQVEPHTEVADMRTGSDFMNTIQSNQKPQGSQGTYWALMAASVNSNQSDAYESWHAEQDASLIFPWGDGVIQATSALALQADFKILYGQVYQRIDTTAATWTADTSTQYRHEVHSCETFLWLTKCLVAPFYLNDFTDTPGSTSAWICWHDCNNTSINNIDVNLNQTYSARHAALEMIALVLPPPIFTYAASNADGRQEFFACGHDGNVYHDWQTAYGGGWSGLQLLQGGGPFYCSNASVGVNADGRLEIFSMDNSGRAWHIWELPGSGWSSWTQFPQASGTLFVGAISSALNPDGLLEAFARGADGFIYHIWESSSDATSWISSWSAMPGINTFKGDPVAAVNMDGRLEVFAQESGTDGSIYSIQKTVTNGGWASGWSNLQSGSLFPTGVHVAVGLNDDGALELFARGGQNNIWHIWQTSGGWSLWTPVHENYAFKDATNPAACINYDGRMEVMGIGTDSDVWHAWQTAPYGAWNSNWVHVAPSGITFVGDPAMVHNSANGLEVIVEDTNGAWYHTWYTPSGGWTNSWVRF